jgi:hypothetical protein
MQIRWRATVLVLRVSVRFRACSALVARNECAIQWRRPAAGHYGTPPSTQNLGSLFFRSRVMPDWDACVRVCVCACVRACVQGGMDTATMVWRHLF